MKKLIMIMCVVSMANALELIKVKTIVVDDSTIVNGEWVEILEQK